jgi:hypothetical protein
MYSSHNSFSLSLFNLCLLPYLIIDRKGVEVQGLLHSYRQHSPLDSITFSGSPSSCDSCDSRVNVVNAYSAIVHSCGVL